MAYDMLTGLNMFCDDNTAQILRNLKKKKKVKTEKNVTKFNERKIDDRTRSFGQSFGKEHSFDSINF